MSKTGTEHFLAELRAVIESADALLKTDTDDASEPLRSARTHAEEKLRVADQFVSENPWRSLGIVAGLAFGVGVLVGRRQ